jgi:hypothetical protein
VKRAVSVAIALAVLATAFALASPARASTYDQSLDAAAQAIEHAGNARGKVPDVHVPPAPLPGPPRYSPSVDDWLQASLRSARSDPKHELYPIARSLRFLAGDGETLTAASAPRVDAKTEARQILAGRAYNRVTSGPAPPRSPSLFERIFDWLGEQFAKLLQGISKAAAAAPFLGKLFTVIIIGLAVFALAAVGFRLAQGLSMRKRPTFDAGELLERPASADEFLAGAQAAAARGDFAKAVSLLFGATLMLLDRSDKIPYDPARTAGEYRRLVRRAAAPIASPFDTLARVFTLAAYADAPVGPEDWQAAQTSYRSLAPALGGG